MLIYCPKCGALIPSKFVDCPECGRHLVQAKVDPFDHTSPDILKLRAESGDSEAMFLVGYRSHFGEYGFEKNDSEARKWLEAASILGHEEAGRCYSDWFPAHNDLAPRCSLSQFDNIIIFTLKTTGLDSAADSIIQLSALKAVPGLHGYSVSEEIDDLIDLPIRTVLSDEIVRITGIDNYLLDRFGKCPPEVFRSFLQFVGSGKTLFISYNAHFHASFLIHAFENYGCDHSLCFRYILDLLTVFRDRYAYPHKLSDALAVYQLENTIASSPYVLNNACSLLELLKAMEQEFDDLCRYVNLFGFNPRYGIKGDRLPRIRYKAQYFNSFKKLYET